MTQPKMPRIKPKTKKTCYSTFHYIAPFQKLCLYKTTKQKNYVPSYLNRLSQNIARKKPKTKQTCYSTFHYILPIHKLCLYKTTTKHQQSIKSYVPGYSNRLSQKMPEKAKNKNKVVTVRLTRYYSFKNYTFTKRH